MPYPVIKLPVISTGSAIKTSASSLKAVYLPLDKKYATWNFAKLQSKTSIGQNKITLIDAGTAGTFSSNGLVLNRAENTFENTGLLDANFNEFTIFGAFKIDSTAMYGQTAILGNYQHSGASGMNFDAFRNNATSSLGIQSLLVNNSTNTTTTMWSRGYEPNKFIFYALSYNKTTGAVSRYFYQSSTGIKATRENTGYVASTNPWVIGADFNFSLEGSTDTVTHPFTAIDNKYYTVADMEKLYIDTKSHLSLQGIEI